ncbi:MAG: hypothetical protein IE937_05670 [Gammaproteobacteria bacterium]|nr:hypothetical protein [Gammaproteobacteria bacterium]
MHFWKNIMVSSGSVVGGVSSICNMEGAALNGGIFAVATVILFITSDGIENVLEDHPIPRLEEGVELPRVFGFLRR